MTTTDGVQADARIATIKARTEAARRARAAEATARRTLADDFGVTTAAEATDLLTRLRTDRDAALAEVDARLTQIGF